MPFGLRPWHIIAIVVVALLIFGPSRLPSIGKSLGKFFKDLKQGTQEMSSSFKEGLAETESTAKSTAQTVSSPSASVPPAAQPMPPPSTQSVATTNATGSDGDKAAEKLFCTACGTPNPPTAKFCRSCGTKIQE